MSISRRRFLSVGAVAVGSQVLTQSVVDAAEPRAPFAGFRFLRPGNTGSNNIDTIKTEDLSKARLTPESWKVEIIGDGAHREAAQVRRRHGP